MSYGSQRATEANPAAPSAPHGRAAASELQKCAWRDARFALRVLRRFQVVHTICPFMSLETNTHPPRSSCTAYSEKGAFDLSWVLHFFRKKACPLSSRRFFRWSEGAAAKGPLYAWRQSGISLVRLPALGICTSEGSKSSSKRVRRPTQPDEGC